MILYEVCVCLSCLVLGTVVVVRVTTVQVLFRRLSLCNHRASSVKLHNWLARAAWSLRSTRTWQYFDIFASFRANIGLNSCSKQHVCVGGPFKVSWRNCRVTPWQLEYSCHKHFYFHHFFSVGSYCNLD